MNPRLKSRTAPATVRARCDRLWKFCKATRKTAKSFAAKRKFSDNRLCKSVGFSIVFYCCLIFSSPSTTLYQVFYFFCPTFSCPFQPLFTNFFVFFAASSKQISLFHVSMSPSTTFYQFFRFFRCEFQTNFLVPRFYVPVNHFLPIFRFFCRGFCLYFLALGRKMQKVSFIGKDGHSSPCPPWYRMKKGEYHVE